MTASAQRRRDTQRLLGAGNPPPGSVQSAQSNPGANPEEFAILRVLADSYWDVQKVRNALTNRTTTRGDLPPVVPIEVAAGLDPIRASEKEFAKQMKRAFKRAAPEVYVWVQATPGLGEHLFARLLGVIGHPVIAQPYHWEGDGAGRVLVADAAFRRRVSDLWSYCGHGDPTRRKRVGMTSDEAFGLGSPRAKTLVRLIAEGCMKCAGTAKAGALPIQDSPSGHLSDDAEVHTKPTVPARRRSPYRDVYDAARIRYAERDWTDAHRHNAALRLVGKEVLRDLWLVAQNKPPEMSA